MRLAGATYGTVPPVTIRVVIAVVVVAAVKCGAVVVRLTVKKGYDGHCVDWPLAQAPVASKNDVSVTESGRELCRKGEGRMKRKLVLL